MRILRYLVASALTCGLAGVAKADSFPVNDFQMVVVDPSPSPSEVTKILTDNFSVTLSACNADQLFGLSPSVYLGCFTGENVTGAPLTSLQILIPIFNFNNQLDQPGCAPAGAEVFSTITCGFTPDGQHYFVDLSGGNIPTAIGTNGQCTHHDNGDNSLSSGDIACNGASIFTIAEAGIPSDIFPTFTVAANVTPEPASVWLMLTGVLSIGLFGAYRRRSIACESRS